MNKLDSYFASGESRKIKLYFLLHALNTETFSWSYNRMVCCHTCGSSALKVELYCAIEMGFQGKSPFINALEALCELLQFRCKKGRKSGIVIFYYN